MATTATGADGRETSVFDSALPIAAKLERARTELLDLSARNRLLNMPRSGKTARAIEIIDEKSTEVIRLLVRENKAFTFLAGRQAEGGKDAEGSTADGNGSTLPDDDEDLVADLAQPEDDSLDARGVANRHVDTKLQTRLTPAGLQKRLLDLYHDARTLEEEQGVNILFLALGTLRWIDPNNAKNVRHAPLVLVPVSLERGNAAEKFKLRWRQEDIAANLSLEAYLERVHTIRIPSFDGGDDFDLTAYGDAVREAVAAKADWTVEPDDIVLGFFSFAKFLMYRDLDPENWPKDAKLSDHALIRPLLSDGFPAGEPLLDEDAPMDAHIEPAEMTHIVDSDSSQTLAVHEVRRGRDIVIQGPPGTGKSQTIANVIASAIADGKRVLFVAEKMAALEVVKRRLDNTGVGDACLELHSNKANKRSVLEELRRTWELGAPRGAGAASLDARLVESRDALNAHSERMHEPSGAAGLTPYGVIGHLVRLRAKGQKPSDLNFDAPERWTLDEMRARSTLVGEIAERIADIGTPAEHPWRGVELDVALPDQVDRIVRQVTKLVTDGDEVASRSHDLADALELAKPVTPGDIDAIDQLATRVAGVPDCDAQALGSEIWDASEAEIGLLLSNGARLLALREKLDPMVTADAWAADVGPSAATLKTLDGSFPADGFDHAAAAAARTPEVIESGKRTAEACGRDAVPATLSDAKALARLASVVAAAPEVDPIAITSDVWGREIERADELVAAVASLETARGSIGDALTDAAWETDVGDARRVLASHGTGFMRLFSGEWRSANRLVRSVLSSPKMPFDEVIPLLDALMRGRKALATIEAESTFGREAFGSDWRGERSASAPLAAIVEWVRSAREHGVEARSLVAKRPDQARLGRAATSLEQACAALQGPLEELWQHLQGRRSVAFGDAEEPGQGELGRVSEHATAIESAAKQYRALVTEPIVDAAGMRDTLHLLIEGQGFALEVDRAAATGAAAFGDRWRGADSDWASLSTLAEWAGRNADIRGLTSRVAERERVRTDASNLRESRDAFLTEVADLRKSLQLSSPSALSDDVASAPLVKTIEALTAWRDGGEALSKWIAYRSRARRAAALGIGQLADAMRDGAVGTGEAASHFDMVYFSAVLADQVATHPELGDFDGELHARTVRGFADLDLQRIRQSALDVARAHHRAIPPQGGGALGPLGVLKGEIARKRGHMPIRQLMQRAAPAIQSLKPVFMMSPLSVAQFLQPGALTFDLLVMDEASQIQPVDALGAIARCKQVVVVGDPRQLPPTAFFSKVTGGDGGDDEDGGTKVADIESILGLFTARGLPMRMLRWHYRSRHESLIAVSNRQFYENKLFIVPSPYTAQGGMGLRFHHVKDGVFDSGASRVNVVEARAVARAIVAHAVSSPEHSLGVVAFSAAQRRAIQDQLEVLRRALPPEHEAFFQRHPAEPFFIKNLENVQGDERDVILISVGYGPITPGGRPPMRFGPVGQDGGERRLNVLISRAKRRCEVFASMTDEDIEPDFASTRKGVYALKMFMHYARTGRMTMAEPSGRDEGSVFEEQVAEALQGLGYEVKRQVGIAGFFIDLAISDPERADRYVLGIECDGESYHSARSARDRDRLRQSILEDHGWIIHRIWSTDWFRRPKEQLDRVVAAIEAAKVELSARGEAQRTRAGPLEIYEIDRGDVVEMGIGHAASAAEAPTPYVEATLARPAHLLCDIHEAPTGVITALVEEVVGIEGPVHMDEVVARVRDAWGAKRAGGRIQDAVERAAAVAVRQGRLTKDGGFISVPGKEPVVRDRTATRSPTLRKPECLPPSEIAQAVLDLVRRNFGATEDQTVAAVSRGIGIKATSAQTRSVIVAAIERSLGDGTLAQQENLLIAGPNAPRPQTGAGAAPSPIESLVAEGEHEGLEFKETLRWDVKLERENTKLEDVVIKTVAGFANHRGGTLLIGVSDAGAATGIERDLALLGGNVDKLELHLNNLVMKHFPQTFRLTRLSISFPSLAGTPICRIDVKRAAQPAFVKLADRSGTVAERLFVRAGNSTQEIRPSEMPAWMREHWA